MGELQELRSKTAQKLAVHNAKMAADYPALLADHAAMNEAREIQCGLQNLVEELDRDIREIAVRALQDLGVTRKEALYLCREAKKHGTCPHMLADVMFTDNEYVIVGYAERGNDDGGIWVTPANG